MGNFARLVLASLLTWIGAVALPGLVVAGWEWLGAVGALWGTVLGLIVAAGLVLLGAEIGEGDAEKPE